MSTALEILKGQLSQTLASLASARNTHEQNNRALAVSKNRVDSLVRQVESIESAINAIESAKEV